MWKDLTMSQKSELMGIFLRNGITSLSQMRDIWNNEYAKGGELEDNNPDENPEVSYNAGTLPEVSVTASYGNPVTYYSPWDKQWYGIGYNGVAKPVFGPGRYSVDANTFMGLRHSRAAQDDSNHWHQTGKQIENLIWSVMPMGASTVFEDIETAGNVLGALRHPVKAYRNLMDVARKSSRTKSASFKSELDWSPEGWFGTRVSGGYDADDVKALNSHLQELIDIERDAKSNGIWLKMADGSKYSGDPREWVMAQTKVVRDNFLDDILTHGDDKRYLTKDGTDVTADIMKNKTIWTSTNPLLGNTYGNKVYRFVIPKDADVITAADAEGRLFRNVLPGMDTDMVVYPRLTDDNVVRINNVVDVGSTPFDYGKDGFPNHLPGEDYLSYIRRVLKGDDLVIGANVTRKSLRGNNGNFDLTNPSIYKGLLPIGLSGAAGLYNNK